MLAATAREAGAPLPVLILHDVGWPYGRRDLYYAPDRIPEEFRQPYAQKGLDARGQGRERICSSTAGFNPTMNNAVRRAAPRNGVMTAVDDFIAEHDEARSGSVVLPIYFGLAIVVEEERIASRPRLGDALERLETPQFLRDLLEPLRAASDQGDALGAGGLLPLAGPLERWRSATSTLLRANLDDRRRGARPPDGLPEHHPCREGQGRLRPVWRRRA